MITAKRAVEILGYMIEDESTKVELEDIKTGIGKCQECIEGLIITEINEGPGWKPVRRRDGVMLFGYRCKSCLGTGIANGICETCFNSYDIPAFPRERLLHQNKAISEAHKKACDSCYEQYASKFAMLRPRAEVKKIQEDEQGKEQEKQIQAKEEKKRKK